MDKVVVVAVMGYLCASSPSRAQPADDSRKSGSPCFRGWTGHDSGGSCSWDSSFCNWERVKKDALSWDLTGTGHVVLEPRIFGGPQKGRLRSPPLCEQAGRLLCVQVKFRFSEGGGTQLDMELCQGSDCTTLLHHVYAKDHNWVIDSVNFVATGVSFRLQIVGEKYMETFWSESNVYLDYVKYDSKTCGEKVTRVTSHTTRLFSLTSPTVVKTPSAPGPETSTGTTKVPEESLTTNREGLKKKGTISSSNVESESKSDDKDKGGEGSVTILIISVSASLLLVLIVTGIVAFVVVRRRHRKTASKATELVARYERNDSVLLVTNELYGCVGQPSSALGQAPYESTAERQRQPVSVTSPECTAQIIDVTSLPKVSTDYDNIDKQTTAHDAGSPTQKSVRDKNGEAVYDIAHDEQGVYENTERSGGDEDKEEYENVPLLHGQPAAEGKETATAEYSHLMGPSGRSDRRREDYDRLK